MWLGSTFDCNSGFELDEGICKDINECENISCGDGFFCHNIDGSFLCLENGATECPNGFEGFPDCQDVNECDSNPCGDNQSCKNIIGAKVTTIVLYGLKIVTFP